MPNDEEAVLVGGRLLCVLMLGKSYAMLTYSRLRRIGAECQTPRAKKPLEESLRLAPVLRPRRAAVPLALYAYTHRPASTLLTLEVAHSFFSCHYFSFRLRLLKTYIILHNANCTLLHLTFPLPRRFSRIHLRPFFHPQPVFHTYLATCSRHLLATNTHTKISPRIFRT